MNAPSTIEVRAFEINVGDELQTIDGMKVVTRIEYPGTTGLFISTNDGVKHYYARRKLVVVRKNF